MFKTMFLKAVLILGLVLVFISKTLAGPPPPTAKPERTFSPVIIPVSSFTDFDTFDGADLKNVVLFSYDADSSKWHYVVSQIDDRNEDGDYFADRDSVFETTDELVFMANAAGDSASLDAWIDEPTSKNYPRYQITVTDDVSGKTKYVYVFRTDDPMFYNDTTDYIQYFGSSDPRPDRVLTDNYELSHDNEGLWTNLNIRPAAGGTGEDILDRMKLRLKGKAKIEELGGLEITLDVNESHIVKDKPSDIVDGKIRVIRRWNIKISYPVPELGGQKIETDPSSFTFKYYPYSSDFGSDTFSMPDYVTLDLVRMSFDLDPTAFGMMMFAPNILTAYPFGVLIDNHDDAGIPRDLDIPGWNWWMQTGMPGSVITQSYLPNIGSNQYLYYKDSPDGTNDGTADTGYDGSWGDTGVKFLGPGITGAIPLAAQLFFFGPDISADSAEVIRSFMETPLKTQVKQNDVTPPAVITDLTAYNVTDSTIALDWTAPGDDGMTGGPASYYILRYNTFPPGESIWDWWSDPTTVTFSPMPKPLPPGTKDTLYVEGLQKNVTYYFVIRSGDEIINWSAPSQASLGETTPVELSSFAATSSKNGVLLEWTTASETNNLGFAIERKLQDSDVWQKVGFVRGFGTTNEEKAYSYNDSPDQIGTLDYRLKQIDTDGAFEYSQIVSVQVEAPSRFELAQNFPNPFNPTTAIHFQLPSSVSGTVELAIYDLLGRKVRTLLNKPAAPGFYQLEWNGRDEEEFEVSSGIYVYVLRAGNITLSKKMIKLQ